MFLETKTVLNAADHGCELSLTHHSDRSYSPAQPPACLLKVIEENMDNIELNPSEVAKNLGMSRASLYRLTAPYGGVQRIITDRRLMAAYDILTDKTCAELTISELAYDLGFNAESTFRRAYKQRYGVSPRETRQATLAR